MVSRQHLIVSTAVALTVAAGVASYVRSVEKAYDYGTRPMSVLVATRSISARKVITEADIRMAVIPSRLVVDGAMRSKKAALGLISRTTMYPGEQVLSSKLLKPGPGAGMVGNIPAGRRAVTVKLDADAGLLGNIAPGDFVDVISVIPDDDGGPGRAITIAQAIPVIAVNGATQESGVQAMTAISQPCAVLAATPDEVQVLALAQEAGSLRLTVRHPNDRNLTHITPSSLQQLVGRGGSRPIRSIPAPTRKPPVEVIRVNGEQPGSVSVVKEVVVGE